MITLTPIFLALLYGAVMVMFSARRTAKNMDQNSTALNDPAFDPTLKRLSNALDLARIRVFIYEVEPINGLAIPDGRIFITRGLLNKYKLGEITAAELASVIAHELGHVALGHTRRRMIDFSAQNAVRTALTLVLARFIPFVGPLLANGAMALLLARISRSDEFEADSYATAVMIKSGLGADAQKNMFRKLDEIAQNSGTAPAWFLSHPKTKDRIKAIEVNEKRWAAG